MGYEIAEQLNWELPDVILYQPVVAQELIGGKRFKEMQLNWDGLAVSCRAYRTMQGHRTVSR